MIRRRTKTLAIVCPSCRLWVKPHRYDPALHRCRDCCNLNVEERFPVAILRHIPTALTRIGA